jgi:hypothetical protein
MKRFDFKSDFTDNAINMLKKHYSENSYLEKKTFAFIEKFEDDEKKCLDDEYFFMKNKLEDLQTMFKLSFKRIDLQFSPAKDINDIADYSMNPYIPKTEDIRNIMKLI